MGTLLPKKDQTSQLFLHQGSLLRHVLIDVPEAYCHWDGPKSLKQILSSPFLFFFFGEGGFNEGSWKFDYEVWWVN